MPTIKNKSEQFQDFFNLGDQTREACARLFSLLTGVSESRLDRSLLPLYVDHLPAGTSTRTLEHYAQLSGRTKKSTKNELIFMREKPCVSVHL